MKEQRRINLAFKDILLQAKRAGNKKVHTVHLLLGDFCGITAAEAEQHWRKLANAQDMQESRLENERVAGKLQCMACFSVYQPQQEIISCPYCGSVGAKVLAGGEFLVKTVEMS